ncbi:siphovirus Gp157 family protein [Aerococcus urinae]|uniref:siphovirus Gp157 family protein n=1 Tax=Aerococcus urinae TaxID=1376 RepID=UPI002551137F|nr:siphovirus Gp157 family protein [Aerococcus urinae]MDK7716056.1 siphovirus Gp157 family protein [Aerococcus urinae]
MNLYQLTENLKYLQARFEQAESEEELQMYLDTYEANEDLTVEKVTNYWYWHKNVESDIDQIKQEKRRLDDKLKRKIKVLNFIENQVLMASNLIGETKFSDGVADIKVQMNNPKVHIIDENLIPKEFFTEQAPKISKTAIKEAINSGIEVPGAELIQEQGARFKK